MASNMHSLMLELYSGRTPTPAAKADFFGREIVATPFGGNYGQAGWVLCVNGSPPRGCIVAIETVRHQTYPPPIFYLEMDKSRRLGSAQADIVREYIKTLADPDRNVPEDYAGMPANEQNKPVGSARMTKAIWSAEYDQKSMLAREIIATEFQDDESEHIRDIINHFARDPRKAISLMGVLAQVGLYALAIEDYSEEVQS